LTMFNKWFLGYWHGGFPFPISATMLQMVTKLVMTRWLVKCCPDQVTHPLPQTWHEQLRTSIPIGVATALDIALSNMSFLFITVTFYTIIKSGSILWLLFWSWVCGLERLRCVLLCVIVLMCGGMALASWGEGVQFSLPGFLLVNAACCFSGIRWALTQVLVESDPTCRHPDVVLYHIAPASSLGLIPLVIAVDAWKFGGSEFILNPEWLLQAMAMVVGGGVFSYALLFAEVKLVELTSGLSFGVIGQVKEIFTIALSMVIFSDNLSPLNTAGLLCAMAATAWYKTIKYREAHRHRHPQEEEGGGKFLVEVHHPPETPMKDEKVPLLGRYQSGDLHMRMGGPLL